MHATVHQGDQQLLGALPDAELVAQIRDGQTAPFELIMRRYNRRLFRIARGILKDDDEAEDAVQEAYVCAWYRLGQFRGPDGFAGWICQIVTNEALMRRRHLRRMHLSGGGSAEAQQLAAMRSPACDPAAQLHEVQLQQMLEIAIDGLPDLYRDAFVLRELEQMSVIDTASCLGIEANAVKTRIHRARKLLQRDLTEDLSTAMKGALGFDGVRCDRLVAKVMPRIEALQVSWRGPSA